MSENTKPFFSEKDGTAISLFGPPSSLSGVVRKKKTPREQLQESRERFTRHLTQQQIDQIKMDKVLEGLSPLSRMAERFRLENEKLKKKNEIKNISPFPDIPDPKPNTTIPFPDIPDPKPNTTIPFPSLDPKPSIKKGGKKANTKHRRHQKSKKTKKTKKTRRTRRKKSRRTRRVHKNKKMNGKTKKTGRKSRKKRKNRGGMKFDTLSGTSDSKRFFDYYLEKQKDLYQDVVIIDESEVDKNKNNVLYVIDMQNDFVDRAFLNDKGEIDTDKLTGPYVPGVGGNIGAFAVNNGKDIIKDIITFLNKNKDKFSKIIFTRDYHDANHCSFNGEDGPFPPHCVIGTPGSGLVKEIKEWITDNKDLADKIQIAFKGMHPRVDTFGAEKYDNTHYATAQIGSKCCKKGNRLLDLFSLSGRSCSDATGSYILKNNEGNALDDELFKTTHGTTPGVGVIDQMNKLDAIKFIPDNTNVYVCGLAGDYCVKDTAYNLKKTFKKSNVNVIHRLTRNAFIPIMSPFNAVELDTNPGDNNLKISKNSDSNKHLSKYIFEYTGSYKLLSNADIQKLELSKIFFDPTIPQTPTPMPTPTPTPTPMPTPTHWHFLTDPRDIMMLYKEAGVKLMI